MNEERRAAPRIRAHLATKWVAGSDMHEGIIRDISRTSCFVLSQEPVSRGLHVFVEVGLPKLLHMRLKGIVMRPVEGVGFGVRFRDLTATEKLMLDQLLHRLENS
jgi:hypothetical protein